MKKKTPASEYNRRMREQAQRLIAEGKMPSPAVLAKTMNKIAKRRQLVKLIMIVLLNELKTGPRNDGKIIYTVASARRISRADPAVRARISREHLWAVKTDQYAPSLITTEKIAAAFEISVARFFTPNESSLLLEVPSLALVNSARDKSNQF